MRWIVDLDGVVYRGKTVLPGAARFFGRAAERGEPLVVVTNNATATPEAYAERLGRMGIPVRRDQVVSSALAAARYVRQQGILSGVLAVGEQGLLEALREHRVSAVAAGDAEPPEHIVAVVVGLDRHFTYAKLDAACDAIRRGAVFVATNTDATYPLETRLAPGAGSVVAAVQACGGRDPVVAGKPHTPIMQMALERLAALEGNHRPGGEDAVMVGDRLDTDVAAARVVGVRSWLMLSGVTRLEEVERAPDPPDAVFEHLEHLCRWLDGEAQPVWVASRRH